jgi:3',5'-cyclic-AMP phosphodiesterase
MAQDDKDGIDRRGALECMIWAGTGVLWTMAGGIPRSSALLRISEAKAQAANGFSFLQISDSHIGFKQPANPNPLATLDEAIAKVGALPNKPAFMIHTGDITHLSKPEEFDNADQAIGKAKLDTYYVPGEHDIVDEARGKAYLERYGKRTQAKGTGWYSFDQNGVHFVGLVNVADLKSGGMGALGDEQLAWLADDLKGKTASTPVVLFAHIPLWTVDAGWGWGTDDSGRALDLVKRFGSVTVLNGHIHQIMQKVEGTVTFHTARSTAFPQPAPGTAPSPGPMKVPEDRLRSVLGITEVMVKRGTQPLAITDSELAKA